MQTPSEKPLTAVCSGSFRDIYRYALVGQILQLEQTGIQVVAPVFGRITTPEDGFARLDTDNPNQTPYELECNFLKTIDEANIHIVVNHHRAGGRAGYSTAAELARAAIAGTPSFITFRSLIYDHPNLWFSDDLTPVQQDALSRLPERGIPTIDGYRINVESLRDAATRRHPISPNHPDYPILTGIYQGLLAILPGAPPARSMV